MPADDGELTFLKIFVSSQLIFLFVIIANQFRGIPLPVIILSAVTLAIVVITQHTPFGRYLYAIGGNEEAAESAKKTITNAIIGIVIVILAFVIVRVISNAIATSTV